MLTRDKDAFILTVTELYNAIIDACIADREISTSLLSRVYDETKEGFLEYLLLATKQDAEFLAETDPAGGDLHEILLCYPGISAMLFHRIANELHVSGDKIKARIISEHSHSLTGIDIHPGATIGNHIAIDHGTGIVIGETALIGNYVRLYHNVSLGNLSVKKQQEGSKRHPTIEDHVTVYAGAIILGGETIIGHHSTIGGGAVVTSSVQPHSLVTTEFTTKYYDKRDRSEYAKNKVSER